MYILALETTGPLGSVALIDKNEKIYKRSSTERMNHLKDLMPMAEQVIKEAGISKSQITAVAASIGPGSFTGIRIGVSSARAIGQALSIPCISVPTLDTFKQKCREATVVCPIFDARRNQVYGAVFSEKGENILDPGPYMLEEVLQVLAKENKKTLFFGDGIDAYRDKIIESLKCELVFAPEANRYQDAEMVAIAAMEKYRKNDIVEVNKLLPEYMRMAEAERKLKDGTLEKERRVKING